MKFGLCRLICCGLLCAVLTPAAVYAQTTVCANYIPVPADGRGTGIVTHFIPASTTHWFTVEGIANRSYSIEIFDPTDGGASVPTPVVYVGATFNTGTCTGTLLSPAPTNTAQSDPGLVTFDTLPFAGERVSFIAPTTDDYVIAITSGGTGFSYTLSVTETTMFSPRWSTFSGFTTFYGFTNTTNSAISVTLRLTNTAGTVVATSTQSIPANQVIYLTTTSLGVANNNAGMATLAHNGPPGGILADAIVGNFAVSPPTTMVTKFEERHSAH
jgi:hypothetical protein